MINKKASYYTHTKEILKNLYYFYQLLKENILTKVTHFNEEEEKFPGEIERKNKLKNS